MALERGVEGPREYVLCHADLGSSTQTLFVRFRAVALADCRMLTAECFFVQPRRADALAGLRIASPLHKEKKTPGRCARVSSCVFALVKERPFRGRLCTLGIDLFAEKLICTSPARDDR
jgi:hypothetical protein